MGGGEQIWSSDSKSQHQQHLVAVQTESVPGPWMEMAAFSFSFDFPFIWSSLPQNISCASRLCMIHGPELGLTHNNLFRDVTLKKRFFKKLNCLIFFFQKKGKMGGAL